MRVRLQPRILHMLLFTNLLPTGLALSEAPMCRTLSAPCPAITLECCTAKCNYGCMDICDTACAANCGVKSMSCHKKSDGSLCNICRCVCGRPIESVAPGQVDLSIEVKEWAVGID